MLVAAVVVGLELGRLELGVGVGLGIIGGAGRFAGEEVVAVDEPARADASGGESAGLGHVAHGSLALAEQLGGVFDGDLHEVLVGWAWSATWGRAAS